MNKKLVFLGILLLVGLMLSGCVWYEGYGYGYGHGYGYGYSYGSPHGYGYYNYGYPYRDHPRRDWDDRHPSSGHGSRYWR